MTGLSTWWRRAGGLLAALVLTVLTFGPSLDTYICRDEGGTLSALELEHYPGMAEAEMLRIANLAIERFELKGLTAIHRYGKIAAGENIVLVIAAAPHRQAAFDGANFVMDYLKTSAPFWKKEHAKDGKSGDWIAAKDSDDSARDKWK